MEGKSRSSTTSLHSLDCTVRAEMVPGRHTAFVSTWMEMPTVASGAMLGLSKACREPALTLGYIMSLCHMPLLLILDDV